MTQAATPSPPTDRTTSKSLTPPDTVHPIPPASARGGGGGTPHQSPLPPSPKCLVSSTPPLGQTSPHSATAVLFSSLSHRVAAPAPTDPILRPHRSYPLSCPASHTAVLNGGARSGMRLMEFGTARHRLGLHWRFRCIVWWTWMQSPRQSQSLRLLSQSPRRGLPPVTLMSMQVAALNPQQHLRKGLDHPLMRPRRRIVMRKRHNRRVNSWLRHTKEIEVQHWSRKDSHRHQRNWNQRNFTNLVSGGTSPAAQTQREPSKGTHLGNKRQR